MEDLELLNIINNKPQKFKTILYNQFLRSLTQKFSTKIILRKDLLKIIKNIFKNKPFTLIPVIVGALNQEMQQYYGKVLAKYFDDENSIFIISSDFCHWGKKYEFTYYNEAQGQIWKSIQKLDGQALNIIQKHDQKQFLRYIEVTQNSICGRHPIGVFLRICKQRKLKLKTKFLKYSMSQRVCDSNMSSVSYASCITWIESKNK